MRTQFHIQTFIFLTQITVSQKRLQARGKKKKKNLSGLDTEYPGLITEEQVDSQLPWGLLKLLSEKPRRDGTASAQSWPVSSLLPSSLWVSRAGPEKWNPSHHAPATQVYLTYILKVIFSHGIHPPGSQKHIPQKHITRHNQTSVKSGKTSIAHISS